MGPNIEESDKASEQVKEPEPISKDDEDDADKVVDDKAKSDEAPPKVESDTAPPKVESNDNEKNAAKDDKPSSPNFADKSEEAEVKQEDVKSAAKALAGL